MTYQERKQQLIDHMPDGIGVDRSKLSDIMIEMQKDAFIESWELAWEKFTDASRSQDSYIYYCSTLHRQLKEYGLIP